MITHAQQTLPAGDRVCAHDRVMRFQAGADVGGRAPRVCVKLKPLFFAGLEVAWLFESRGERFEEAAVSGGYLVVDLA